MSPLEIKLLESAILIVVFLIVRVAINKIVDRTVSRQLLLKTRGKIVKKILHLTLVTMILILNLIVWGVDHSELFAMIASVFAVIGLALFAQWSHLSNITSGIIMFFAYSAKIDDTVSIIDKDFEVEGRISDIGLFFVILKTKNGEEISLPNNTFLQKMTKKMIKH